MAESAVVFLVEKLTPLLEEEVKLLSGFREEVSYMRDELERMRAFLRAAEALEDEDEEIEVWVKQVRDVAYDTEDILDEFLLHFSHQRQRGFHGCLCKIAHTIKKLKARHRVASGLQSIKTRVINISEGHQRYGYKLHTMAQKGSSSNANARKNDCSELRSDARLLEEAQLVGIDTPKQDLVTCLVKGISNLKVLALIGMGGLGKTTLASKVYVDAEVKKHFQSHAWLTVSQSFKLDDLLRQIIQQLFDEIKQPLPQGADSTDNHILKTIIIDFLRGRRYFLVLDDVWSVEAWDAIKMAFPNSGRGSRLMITTRVAEVASSSTTELEGMIYRVKPLSSEESWTLFCAKSFQGNLCPPHLEILSQNILKRCEGLPLAIVSIGGMLATKDINYIEEWEIVERFVCNTNKLKSMKEILLLSFNDLPHHLKYCFMYLSMFPEDCLIRRSRLVQLWIAEGFIKEKQGRTLEEVGVTYFNELLNRSLIQVAEKSSHGRIKSCRVHDLLREIVLLKSKDQNFAMVASEQIQSLPEKLRRLSVHKTNEYIQANHKFSRLRSLLIFGLEDSDVSLSTSTLFNCRLKLLKVLDCSGTHLDTFPEALEGLETLSNLQTLSTIDVNQGGSDLIGSLGELKQLRRLDIQQVKAQDGFPLCSSIQKLRYLRSLFIVSRDEDEILNLQDITSPPQYLQRLSMNGRLEKLPNWICKLSSLVKLVLARSGLQLDPLEALQGLPNLIVLEFAGQAYHGETFYFKDGGFQKLKTLSFSELDRMRKVMIEKGAMPRLEELWLEDCKLLEEVPSGVQFLRNLKYLGFFHMAEELIMRLRQKSEDTDYFNIKHVSSVYIGRVVNGEINGDYL